MIQTLATATAAYHGNHWYGPGPGFGPGFGPGHCPGFAWLFLLIPLFWVGLIVLVAILFGRRWRRAAVARGYGPGRGGWAGTPNPAEQTLSDRFARGDIDEVEYRARLEVLRAGQTSST